MTHEAHCTTRQDGIQAHCDCDAIVVVQAVLCALCRERIEPEDFGKAVADHYVYDIEGDLDYIELAHKRCAQTDNDRRLDNYWTF